MIDFLKTEQGPIKLELFQIKEIFHQQLNKGIIPKLDLSLCKDPELAEKYFNQIYTYQELEQKLDLATEYAFHSHDLVQKTYHEGYRREERTTIPEDDWQNWLEVMTIRNAQAWNHKHPFCSFVIYLNHEKYRLSFLHFSLSPHGISKLFVRKITTTAFDLDAYSPPSDIKEIIQSKASILVAGATGSGKTSFLSSLLKEISPKEHVIILEDTEEIIPPHPLCTKLLTKEGEKNLKDYMPYALRMTPDRLILGEMRSDEVVPFIMCMNTGHKGLMSTIHANSGVDAILRAALLYSVYANTELEFNKIIELICRGVEYVVFLENKKIKEIIKILGSHQGVPLYQTIQGELDQQLVAF